LLITSSCTIESNSLSSLKNQQRNVVLAENVYNTTKIKYLLNNKKQIVIVIISTIITTFPLIFYWKYTTNHWLMIPAVAGAFVGTFVGMKIKKKNNGV
jgi:hypothetical protein